MYHFMRVIKLALISVIVFALFITGFSLFFPSRVRISKAIDINAPKNIIHPYLADINNWKTWYPGADTMTIIEEDGRTGLRNRAGGKISISAVTDTTVVTSTSGAGLKSSVSGWNLHQSGLPNTVTVQWYMDIKLRWYPWEKFSGLLLEKRYGPVMQQGLERLKAVIEK
jgi:hypothetical protein